MSRAFVYLILALSFSMALAQPTRPGRDRGMDRQRGESKVSHPLLTRATEVQSKLRYTGTRRIITRLGPDRRENVEKVWFDAGKLRVEFLQGSTDFGQIIVISNGQRQHFFPASNEIQVRPARIEEPLARLGEFNRGRRNTVIREMDGGMVAGQRTTLLAFADENNNTLGRIWIDPDNAMVLKRELLDPSGRLVGSMEFLTVNYRPTFSADDFRINRRGAKVLTVDDLLRQRAADANLRPMRIPDGFQGWRLESVRTLPLGDGRVALSQQYVGDRGRRVSIFIVRGNLDGQRLRRSQGTALSSFTRRVGDLSVIAVGGMAEGDLQELADQVR